MEAGESRVSSLSLTRDKRLGNGEQRTRTCSNVGPPYKDLGGHRLSSREPPPQGTQTAHRTAKTLMISTKVVAPLPLHRIYDLLDSAPLRTSPSSTTGTDSKQKITMDSSKAPVKLVKVKTVLGRTGTDARLTTENIKILHPRNNFD
jgi:hypothetical protein